VNFPKFRPKHDKAAFEQLRSVPPNRICFATTHQNALKKNNGSSSKPFKFEIPFAHGVASEFFAGTKIVLQASKFSGLWTPLSEEDADRVRDWMHEQGSRVYSKDLFNASISLGPRSVDKTETEVGKLFSAAKYGQDADAAQELSRLMRSTVADMKSWPAFSAVTNPPPREGKEFDLPTFLAERIAKKLDVPYVSMGIWKGEKGQLKDVARAAKWDTLQGVGFVVNSKAFVEEKPILIIDDIYQSGTTLNFLRSRLSESGFYRAFALTVVKADRDSDNQ
jgi:predicted amidophosphoribosyltransferase